MKKIIHLLPLILLLQVKASQAQEPVNCPTDGKSLEVIDPKESKSLERLKQGVEQSVCNKETVFLDISKLSLKDQLAKAKHDRLRCGQIEMCNPNPSNKALQDDAKEILKEAIPKAALINILSEEIKNNRLKYNLVLNRFEEKKLSVCQLDKVEAKCEASINKALASIGRKFFAGTQIQQITKKEPVVACAQRVTLNKICKLSEDRVKEIAKCDSDNKKDSKSGCLDKEQLALASLINDHVSNEPLFLSIEKQLCVSSRLVPDANAQASLLSQMLQIRNQGAGLRLSGNRVGLNLHGGSTQGLRAPASENGAAEAAHPRKPDAADRSTSPSGNGPTASDVIRAGALEVGVPKAAEADEIKGVGGRDNTTLSEQFSNSMNEIAQIERKDEVVNNNSANNSLSADFTNRFNAITEEEKKKKEDEELKKKEELARLDDESGIGGSDKKKREEMNALVAQISSLKAKIEDMNANVDELKSKKTASVEEKEKNDKEAQEREKSILELKKKLADMENDRKKIQSENIAKAAEVEKVRAAKEEAHKISQAATIQNFANHESEKNDVGQRERDKVVNGFNQPSANYAESRAPASVASTGGNGTTPAALVLKSAGSQATPESSVVYMTDGELQKYPFHLNDNATNSEIEKMILVNKGASIILGNSEQIIPMTENGVVLLDEAGKVRYKRVKISLVKNDRERRANIAREISSIADLKREEQKKRDLIRYQEMKSAIKKATDKK